MSVSVRESAILAIVAALRAPGSPALNVYRSRLEQIADAELPCFDVAPHEEKIDDPGEFGDHGSVTRTLTVKVCAIVDAGAAEGEASDVDDRALDPLYVFAIQQLTDDGANLGGIVDSVEELGHANVFQPAGLDLLGLEMSFAIHFATKRGDPARRG